MLPERKNLEPSYEEKHFSADDRRGQLRLLASRDGRNGSVSWHQDVDLYGALLANNQRVTHELRPGRHAWIQVARGSITLNGTALDTGDAAEVRDERRLDISATNDAELLVFDLA